MRVADSTLKHNVVRNLRTSMREMSKLQLQLASGKAINKPSDNPVMATKILNINAALSESQQFLRNVQDGEAWLNMTDSTLDKMGEALHRARELSLGGLTGTAPEDARRYTAMEIDQVIRHMVSLANSSFDGDRFIFGGSYFRENPYVITETDGMVSAVTPNPNGAGAGQGKISYEIIRGISMDVNTPGQELLMDGDIFTSLIALRDALLGTGDGDEAIRGVDKALDHVLYHRAVVGAKTNRLDMTAARYGEEQMTLRELKSRIEDVDIAEAIMNFNVKEKVYHASLAMGARVMQPTLLDYIR